MITVKASEFKAKCLKMMDDITAKGQTIIITKHGKPVAKLSPYGIPPKELFGFLKGQITYKDESVFESDALKDVWDAWDEERNL